MQTHHQNAIEMMLISSDSGRLTLFNFSGSGAQTTNPDNPVYPLAQLTYELHSVHTVITWPLLKLKPAHKD